MAYRPGPANAPDPLRQIEANPDSHKELISLLPTTVDLDAVRKAREAMHEIFPFTEEMWLSWLQDELPALSDIRALFEEAVDDYIAPGQFAVDKMYKFEEETEFPRKVFERAILLCGHHVTKGSLIWDSYRAFEMVILSSMQGMQQEEESDEELVKSIKAQYDRVDKLFKRQLAIPLLGMDSTLVEYNKFDSKEMDENKLQTYGMALKKLKEIEPFEKELSMSEVPSLETFREYILYELKCKDLARISCLYERALSVHCLKDDLWLEYLKHLDSSSSLKVKEIVLSAHHRSVRNCPWSAELWISLVRAIERMGSERDEVIVNFKKALSGNFSTPGDHLRMWMCYCEYKQRAVVNWNAKESLDVKKLRKIFKRAKKSLFDKFGAEGDPKWTLHRYEAQIEARYLGNLDRSRELYEEILKSDSSRAEMWLEYVNLERYHGDKTKCLSLYNSAVDRVYDDAEKVFESFLSFERLEGSLDSVVMAEERICAKREKLERKKMGTQFNNVHTIVYERLQDLARQKCLYQHQVDALKALKEELDNPFGAFKDTDLHNVSLAVLPTGTGKSGIAILAPYVLNTSYVLVITPSITISEQLFKDFNTHPWLIKRGLFRNEDKNDFVPSTRLIRETTDLHEVQSTALVIANAHKFGNTSNVNIEDIPQSRFDLVIVDEAHHYPAKTWKNIVTHFKGRKVVFLTATPYNSGEYILQANNKKKRPCYQLTYDDAVEKGIIRPKVFTEVTTSLDGELDQTLLRAKEIMGVLSEMKTLLTEHDEQDNRYKHQGMISAQTVEEGESIVKLWNSLYFEEGGKEEKAAAYVSNTSKTVLDDFAKGMYRILVVIYRCTEGFDRKNVSVVGILRNIQPSSKVYFTQFVGRAVRRFDASDRITAHVISHKSHNQRGNFNNMDKVAIEHMEDD